MDNNFATALRFVWAPGFDDPADGYHRTEHDPGLGTLGGVTEATWDDAVAARLVTGALKDATTQQLSAILEGRFWGGTCDDLPAGIDVLLFNGRMMSGHFPRILQQCLGLMGLEVDGVIGPHSIALVRACDPPTLIDAVSGSHAAYLTTLTPFAYFGRGWIARLKAAQATAHSLANACPPPKSHPVAV